MEYIGMITAALCRVTLVICALTLVRISGLARRKGEAGKIKSEIVDAVRKSGAETLDSMERYNRLSSESGKMSRDSFLKSEELRFSQFSRSTNASLETLRKTVTEMNGLQDRRFKDFREEVNRQIDGIRLTMERKMSELQASNERKLERMRRTVDEKLQKTLDERISRSFKAVSERLELVYKSLGEMQKVGRGVDDLRKVLSNVKTRGILGEVRLGAILEEILSPEQYVRDVATKRDSRDRVEFAVKLPGADEGPVLLPIDAKFPLDAYQNLLAAYDSGDREAVSAAAKELKTRIRGFARDISEKYIDPPATTEFAVMFLPTEGLYAEVVRYGMIEELQKYKVNIAGPTTMAALLNSLQMGFRTLAIQKKSGRVWKVLEEVKTEFSKFSGVLRKTQENMRKASDDLDRLIGTRTNAINRKLRDVSALAPGEERPREGQPPE